MDMCFAVYDDVASYWAVQFLSATPLGPFLPHSNLHIRFRSDSPMSSLCLNLTQISDCCTEPCKRSAIEVLILKYDKIALALATFLICDFGCTFEALSDPSPSPRVTLLYPILFKFIQSGFFLAFTSCQVGKKVGSVSNRWTVPSAISEQVLADANGARRSVNNGSHKFHMTAADGSLTAR